MKRTKLDDRILPTYSKGEEIFNMVSHIVGGAIGIATLVLGIIISAIHHNGYGIASSIVLGVTVIVLYTMSSIYHGLSPKLKAKKGLSNNRSLFNIFINSRNIYTILFMYIKRSRTYNRMGDVWHCLGSSCTRNNIKCNRY